MSRENRQEWEIEQVSGGLRVRVLTNDPAKQQPWTFIPCSAIKQVTGSYLKNFGQVLSNNQRKNPIRETNRVMITISFHDENESSPISYDLNYVHNQPTWTPDVAGLNQAISDISSWCGAAGTAISVIENTITGNTENPSIFENSTPGNNSSTNSGVRGFSILFEGSGGAYGGVSVDSGYIDSKVASMGNTLSSQSYRVPLTADPDFPNSPRVLISYITP